MNKKMNSFSHLDFIPLPSKEVWYDVAIGYYNHIFSKKEKMTLADQQAEYSRMVHCDLG